jgi:hypothetical protein
MILEIRVYGELHFFETVRVEGDEALLPSGTSVMSLTKQRRLIRDFAALHSLEAD